jgi:hypothetical protein
MLPDVGQFFCFHGPDISIRKLIAANEGEYVFNKIAGGMISIQYPETFRVSGFWIYLIKLTVARCAVLTVPQIGSKLRFRKYVKEQVVLGQSPKI